MWCLQIASNCEGGLVDQQQSRAGGGKGEYREQPTTAECEHKVCLLQSGLSLQPGTQATAQHTPHIRRAHRPTNPHQTQNRL